MSLVEMKLQYEEGGRSFATARAYINALEAELAAVRAEVAAPWHVGAFIDVDGFKVGPHMAREYREELAALKAENERLKCCGNCQYRRTGSLGERCSISGWLVVPHANCQLTPSRWEARP